MEGIITTINKDNLRTAAQLAAGILDKGGVIATPTDTIYGLAANVQNKEAVRALYNIKGRDFNKPIAICISEVADVHRWAQVDPRSQDLLKALFPGPVTLLFERSRELNRDFNPNTNVVGVRIPDHSFIREVCRNIGEPLALTSANKSSQPSCVKVQEFKTLFPQIQRVFQTTKEIERENASRAGSTIVDLTQYPNYKITRPGCALNNTKNILHSFNLVELKE